MRRLLPIFFTLALLFGCQGTETGNPGMTGGTPTSGDNAYENSDFGVSTSYDDGWTVSEEAAGSSEGDSDYAPDSDGAGDPSPMMEEGINTSEAPSTVFTDGVSTITLYYVTLSPEPVSLLSYLQTTLPTITFVSYSNGSISGYYYDTPDPGSTGGDQFEFFFLNGTTLLYIVTDLFDENDALANFDTILESLRFE